MNKFKAFIFDFDGVIIDSETKKFNDVKEVLSEYGYNLSDDVFNNFIGKKRDFFIEEYYPDISLNERNEIVNKFREKGQDPKGYILIQGINELILYLKSNNYKIAIATGSSKTFVSSILDRFNLQDVFDVIVTGDDTMKSKPDPDCFNIAIEKLNVPACNIVIVEDSIAGVEAAKKTDSFVIGLNTYLTKADLSVADVCFKDHVEILEYFIRK